MAYYDLVDSRVRYVLTRNSHAEQYTQIDALNNLSLKWMG